jgi:hypothetical protein
MPNGGDSTGKTTPHEGRTAIEGMLDVARYHREHERFHSLNGLETAMDLRRDANALKVVAERWLAVDQDTTSSAVDYQDPRFRAAGSADLNDRTAVATTGILFMEGEHEPAELTQMKERLRGTAAGLAATSGWLAEKMDAGWQREQALLTSGFADAVHPRLMALTRTTLTGAKLGVVARLLGVAAATLQRQDLRPPGIRKDRRGAGRVLLTASWLIDRAAALMAEQSAELSLSDPDWTRYIEMLESKAGARTTASSPADASSPPNRRPGEGEGQAPGPRTRTRPTASD